MLGISLLLCLLSRITVLCPPLWPMAKYWPKPREEIVYVAYKFWSQSIAEWTKDFLVQITTLLWVPHYGIGIKYNQKVVSYWQNISVAFELVSISCQASFY